MYYSIYHVDRSTKPPLPHCIRVYFPVRANGDVGRYVVNTVKSSVRFIKPRRLILLEQHSINLDRKRGTLWTFRTSCYTRLTFL